MGCCVALVEVADVADDNRPSMICLPPLPGVNFSNGKALLTKIRQIFTLAPRRAVLAEDLNRSLTTGHRAGVELQILGAGDGGERDLGRAALCCR